MGQSLATLGSTGLRQGCLFRSGRLESLDACGVRFETTIGLRRRPQRVDGFGVYVHKPFPAESTKYDGTDPRVRHWLQGALALFHDARYAPPYLVHCAHGTDRTGMLISAFLFAIGEPYSVVLAEYALSPGADLAKIDRFLKGLASGGVAGGPEMRAPAWVRG